MDTRLKLLDTTTYQYSRIKASDSDFVKLENTPNCVRSHCAWFT